jgi:uncharacterized protein (AIM24 family)
MVAKSFDKSLRALVRRRPFQPFVVELVSGERIRVEHPEALAFDGGVAVHISTEGDISLFDHESVSRLTRGKGEKSA